MIDLRTKELPSTITVDNVEYELNTDFRLWLAFADYIVDSDLMVKMIPILFKGSHYPSDNWIGAFDEMVKFWKNENSTPVSSKSASVKLVDYIEDGEYIYSSFLQAYGIDLLRVDMHWHQFQALFRGLPDNCKIKEIMGYRGYEKNEKSQEDRWEESKKTWSFQQKVDEDLMSEINELLYNC